MGREPTAVVLRSDVPPRGGDFQSPSRRRAGGGCNLHAATGSVSYGGAIGEPSWFSGVTLPP
jgi:hypothetical protein